MKKLTILKNSPPADLEQIESFEDQWKLQIPKMLKRYFLTTNAQYIKEGVFKKGYREFWVHNLFPFDKDYELSFQRTNDLLNEFYEGKYLSFADDPGGWQFVISVQEEDHGQIYFCRMDEELQDAVTHLANNFEEFMNALEISTE